MQAFGQTPEVRKDRRQYQYKKKYYTTPDFCDITHNTTLHFFLSLEGVKALPFTWLILLLFQVSLLGHFTYHKTDDTSIYNLHWHIHPLTNTNTRNGQRETDTTLSTERRDLLVKLTVGQLAKIFPTFTEWKVHYCVHNSPLLVVI
jgi:hypothetical protein